MPGPDIPYAQLQTLFLDVGNTLVSIDFAWVRDELAGLGVECTVAELRRAEAAARPIFSDAHTRRPLDWEQAFELYLRTVLEKLPDGCLGPQSDASQISGRLAPVLNAPGQTQRLWSYVLPGVPEALRAFRGLGLRLVAVSNSDGTVEEGLAEQGLRPFFEAVIDSAIVGFEKPDPRIFHHAVAVSGADPARTLHVGDMFFADVVGAREAGIHALLLDPFDDWRVDDCPRVPDLTTLAAQLTRARQGRGSRRV